MIKTLAAANKSERVKVKVPRSVQQSIPIKRIYTNGIWEVGNKHSRSWKLTDVNYIAASQETRERIFSAYCGALNSMPTDATAKITIVNHRLNPAEFERRILFPYKDDWLDHYREEANSIMKGRAAQSNNARPISAAPEQICKRPLPAWTLASPRPETMTGSVCCTTSSVPAMSSISTMTITALCRPAEIFGI